MKKILSVIVALMVMAACLLTVAADEPVVVKSVADITEVKGGETVTITVSISEAKFATYAFALTYDSTYMTIVEESIVENEDAPANGMFLGNAENNSVSGISAKDKTFGGVLLTYKVLIAENIPAGEYTVGVSMTNPADAEFKGSVGTADGTVLDVTIENATIVVAAPEHVHAWSDWTVETEAGCETDGLKVRTCECGEKQEEVIPATGHAWGEWKVTKEAEIDVPGEEARECANCGKIETRPTNPKTGDFIVVAVAMATASVLGTALIGKKKF